MMGVDRTPFYEGIQAYQSGDLERAIDRFRSQLCHAPDEWECRLYLGMAYARIGRMLEAKREFMDIRDMCADESLRKKAAAAFSMLVESSLKKPQAN